MKSEAVDNQLFEALRLLYSLVEELADDEQLSEEQVFSLIRLAYGKGYIDASKQPNQETARRLAIALELLDPLTGEICDGRTRGRA